MGQLKYDNLSKDLDDILKEKLPQYNDAIRRYPDHDIPSVWRPCYVRDVEKIIHSPYYNRYADKTQVFSFYKNDDISRRALHVQLVSRIARNIGTVLGLNLDLIEAIALGHDIGHTPFGHAGERFLSEIYHAQTNCFFNHNVQSVRVLDQIFHYNISLQTLDGILCHNGEFLSKEYRPSTLTDFDKFDKKVEECYYNEDAVSKLIPNTLEGCVVRISDMIAYIGKDRQDAVKAGLLESEDVFDNTEIGRYNAQIINNVIVNIIENSYGKDYITLDDRYYQALKQSKIDNYNQIYMNERISNLYNEFIKPMFERIYMELLKQLVEKDTESVVYKHHIKLIESTNKYYQGGTYRANSADQIVTDYIASMTDDYFYDLYQYLFPKDTRPIPYVSYFKDREKGE